MTLEPFATRARSFIATVDLPPAPPRTRGPADAEVPPDAAALAVGQTLVEFAPGADPDLRRAVTDALLLAQLAADKRGADTPDQWYAAHAEVLAHLGFRSAGLTRTAQDFAALDTDLHEAILPVITAAFAGMAVPALILDTLRQMSQIDAGQPWITLFERESRRFNARQFQVGLVDGSGTEQTIALLGFVIELATATTQVLFLRQARDSVAVERLDGRFAADSRSLAAIAPDLAAKLADRRGAYLAALEI